MLYLLVFLTSGSRTFDNCTIATEGTWLPEPLAQLLRFELFKWKAVISRVDIKIEFRRNDVKVRIEEQFVIVKGIYSPEHIISFLYSNSKAFMKIVHAGTSEVRERNLVSIGM